MDGRRGGRQSGTDEARELLALWSALSENGATLNATNVSQRLAIDEQTARRLIGLVVTARGELDDFLAVYSSSDDDLSTITLMDDAGTRGRPLRLTRPEVKALLLALGQLGTPSNDELREKLLSYYTSADISPEEVTRTLASAMASPDYDTIRTCAEAIAAESQLVFRYKGSVDSNFYIRHVIPKRIRANHGSWLLDSFDTERQGSRTFRIDRIKDVVIRPHTPNMDVSNAPGDRKPRMVSLHFNDGIFLERFDWPGIEIQSVSQHGIDALIPYYGRSYDWLPRHICACGGSVTTNDRELNDHIRRYAKDLLSFEEQLPSL